MLCPKCDDAEFDLSVPCLQCEFTGESALLLRLSQLEFLLNEADSWPAVVESEPLKLEYTAQLQQVEIELGLQDAPLSVEAVQALREERQQLLLLRQTLKGWQRAGWLLPASRLILRDEMAVRKENIENQLADAPDVPLPTGFDRLHFGEIAQIEFCLQMADTLFEEERIEDGAFEALRAQLEGELERLEVQAGLREPVAVPVEPAPVGAEGGSAAADSSDEHVPPLKAERKPWTWDRVWETLLSERTLQAILFMGVALMFAAALSLVVYNWDTFPPTVQVAFLAGFTALFYALGWYVRSRMNLYGSGIALSAIASLLVPLDFYAFYLSGGFPQDRWQEVWLFGSAICLLVYLIATYSSQAQFFGYLVGLAGGSLLTASLNYWQVDQDWWQSGLMALAFALALSAERLYRRARDSAWRVLATPFWRLALLCSVPLLLIGLALGFLGGRESRVFFFTLAVNWWLGGLLFALATRRYRLQIVGLVAALAFPVAMGLSEYLYFQPLSTPLGWYALGWALLVPVYWLAGWALEQHFWRTEDELERIYGRQVLVVGGLLVAVAAVWSFANTSAATVVHLLLALFMFLAAVLWQQSRLMWGMSLFLLTGSAAWQASRGATPAELALPWALLSIGHLIIALRVDQSAQNKPLSALKQPHSPSNEQDESLPPLFERLKRRLRAPLPNRLRLPLYGAGLFLAGMAILPPLFLFDQSLLAYALLNWIGINGWLAYLLHSQPNSALAGWFAPNHKQNAPEGAKKRRFWSRWWQPSLFQWLAALSIVPWWWVNWTNGRVPSVSLALGYALLALGLLWCTVRVRRVSWTYGRPWQVAAHLSNMIAFGAAFAYFDQPWTASILLLIAGFYFMAAPLLYERYWLLIAALIFPLGWLNGLDWWGLPVAGGFAAMALLVLAYLVVPFALVKQWKVRTRLVQPLYDMGFLIGACMILPTVMASFGWGNDPQSLFWIASAFMLLSLSFVFYTWLAKRSLFGHMALWLAVYGAGLIIKIYSHGSGRSAFLAALLAVGCVLGERLLHQAARLRVTDVTSGWWNRFSGAPIRQTWRLFRQPLLFAGWVISAGAIGAALFRNMMWLGGGTTRQLWAIAGLFTITGLYALSARLFKKARFVWFASFLIFFPWTLSVDLVRWNVLEWSSPVWYAPSWMLLALCGLGVGVHLARRLGWNKWSWAPQVSAHLLVALLALLWSLADSGAATVSFGLDVLFYLFAVWIDRRFQAVEHAYLGRFLYPTAALLPVWALCLYTYLTKEPTVTTSSLIMLAFVLPMLWVGRRLEWWERSGEWMDASLLQGNDPFLSRPYSLPLYMSTYIYAVIGTTFVSSDRPLLIGVLLFNTALMVLSAYLFRQRLWLYIGTITLPMAVILFLIEQEIPANRYGWALIALGAGYLAIARLLRSSRWAETSLFHYSQPFLVASFAFVALGLLPSSQDRLGAIVGYGAAAAIYLITALWLRRPVFSAIAAGLVVVPYWVGALELGLTTENDGLALWPGILVSLLFARQWHHKWTIEHAFQPPTPSPSPADTLDFPWLRPLAWPSAIIKRILSWWPFPLYLLGFGGLLVSPLLALENQFQLCVVLTLGTLVYLWAIYRFKRRGWLLLASLWIQLTALAFIRWMGWTDTPAQIALAFTPVTVLTAAIALLIEYVFDEGLPLLWGEEAMLRFSLSGWSRPLYALLVVDIVLAQAATLISPSNGVVTLSHVFILSILALVWNIAVVAYLPMVLGVVALMQRLQWVKADFTQWPIALAWLALIYGAIGYGILFWQRQRAFLPSRLLIWQEPLQRGGWLVSILALILPLQTSTLLLALVFRTLFSPELAIQAFELAQIEMLTLVFAITGLFYLTAALVERKRDWGYGALFLLLSSWSVWLLLIQAQRELQLYVLPASLYLLGLGWLEWEYGNRRLAVWVDRLGLFLLFGSVLWQSFGEHGSRYALLMIIEGLLVGWLGSLRRLRRLLYAGVVAVITAVISQLIDPLFELDTLVLLLLGASLLALAIALERRLEEVRTLSKEWRARLENWS